MKRVLYLALALVMPLLLFSGCAPSPAPSDSMAAVPTEAFHFNGQDPVVTITMADGGVITAELYPDKAPNTVYNFVSLIRQKHYDGLIAFIADPSENAVRSADDNVLGYTIAGEFSNNMVENDLSHTRGVLSMVRDDANDLNSASDGFLIMVADDPSLDSDYAAFGKVTAGMDIVDAVAASGDTQGAAEVKMVTVDTKGNDFPEPDKIPLDTSAT